MIGLKLIMLDYGNGMLRDEFDIVPAIAPDIFRNLSLVETWILRLVVHANVYVLC